jgi:hypothetical protein
VVKYRPQNNELPNNTSSTGFTGTTICVGGSPQLTFDAIDSSFSTPYSITYKNDATSVQYTTSIPNASPYSFTPGDNPTANATYTLVSISNASCTRTTGFGNSGANLIVRPIPTTTISGTTSICLEAASPNIVFTNPQTAAITVTYTINGGANQAIDVAAGSFTNVPVSTVAANTFVYNLVSVMYKTSICSNAISGSAIVTVNALPTTPLTTITQPNCITATGTIVVAVQSNTDTYSFDNGFSYQASNTKSGLTPANYSILIKNSVGCISPVSNVEIIASSTKTWSGSWMPSAPTSNDAVNFASGTYTSTGDLAVCSCQVTGAIVTINQGHTLTVTNAVTVSSGSLTFKDKASLVQTNNVTNSGNIIYKRITNTTVRNTDYTFWSSPVSPMNLAGVGGITYNPSSLAGSMFYSYLVTPTSEDWLEESASTTMVAGNAYSIRGPNQVPAGPPSLLEATFLGVPNNGDYSIAVTNPNSSYLLGNPYPSAIDADQFLSTNAGIMSGTLYFWTHNTQIGNSSSNLGSGALAYTSDDYATYNRTGGTGVDSGTSTSAAVSGGAIPSGKIGAGQGFFASSKAIGTITFNNNMRVSGNNTQFFKTKNDKSKIGSSIEKNRIWLNMTNKEGAFKQTLVGYISGATNSIDDAFDGESFDGQEFIDFYSLNQDKNLTIQGRALPFNENDEVNIGFRSTIAGAFTINIAQVDGTMTHQDIFIEDKLTNTITDLKKENYTFNTDAGKFNNRFVLKYKNSNKTLKVEEVNKVDGILVLYSNYYKTLIVQNNIVDSTVKSISLFNMSGQNIEVWDVEDNNHATIQIPMKVLSSGVYIVKVKTNKGESSSKIVINE